jgi:hypothetical protein
LVIGHHIDENVGRFVSINGITGQMGAGTNLSGYAIYRGLTPKVQLTEDKPTDLSQCCEMGGKLSMKHLHFLLLALFVFARATFGQHGTAENGYYPAVYQGDTWTGVVVSASEQTGEITLSYTKGGKSQTFIGVPEAGYLVHEHTGATRPLKMSDIPIGKIVKVWYIEEAKKVGGSRVKVNTIFLIDALANAKAGLTYFKAFR